jgi:hypothetical protein
MFPIEVDHMSKTTVLITGNTYPVREQLKALGGVYDGTVKGWRVPADKADEASKIVASAPAKRSPNTSPYRPNGMGGICAACGDDCGGGLWSCGYGETPRGE